MQASITWEWLHPYAYVYPYAYALQLHIHADYLYIKRGHVRGMWLLTGWGFLFLLLYSPVFVVRVVYDKVEQIPCLLAYYLPTKVPYFAYTTAAGVCIQYHCTLCRTFIE